ncbi:unnamed protein product, partial [Symbiodinium sp. KB8]
VLMGARSRPGTGRDPRAVAIELDDFDFDPNPSSSASSAPAKPSTVTATATGIDVVDPEELKRRIRGTGSVPMWSQQLRERTGELCKSMADWLRQQARERPKVAFGLFGILLLLAMFGGIWLTARGAVPPDGAAVSASLPGTTTASLAEVVVDSVAAKPEGTVEVEPDEVVAEPKRTSKAEDPAQAMFAAVQKETKRLRQEISALRSDVQEVKALLRSNFGSGAEASRERAAATEAPPVPSTARPVQEDSRPVPAAAVPAVEEGDNDPGEIRIAACLLSYQARDVYHTCRSSGKETPR